MSLRRSAGTCVFQCVRCSNRASPSLPQLQRPSIISTSRLAHPPRRRFAQTPKSRFSTTSTLLEAQSKGPTPRNTTPAGATSESWGSKFYTFEHIQSLISNPDPKRILIDVREPHELSSTGTIPTSHNIPLTTSPDALFLPADEFEDRFEFPRPDDETEVIFYCRAGVRSRAAAKLARQARFGGTTAEFPGSWLEWERRGGEGSNKKPKKEEEKRRKRET